MKTYHFLANHTRRPVVLIIALLVALLAQMLPPAGAQAAAPFPDAPRERGDVMQQAAPSAEPAAADATGILFRTRVRVATSYRWLRLKALEIVILDQGPDWALVLADSEQLETLARLQFRPSESNDLGALNAVHAAGKPWLAASLKPLMAQVGDAQSRLAVAATVERSDALASLRVAIRALTPEQRAGIAGLASLDDDADGLTNTQEAWWCTDPLNPDTDSDGRTDGQEINALKAWLGNESGGPPGETPWPDWPFDPVLCPDKDADAIPNLAERWELGLNMDWESTDRDRYDDGQELFGVTYCPGSGSACGYGTLPSANHDGVVLFPQMPSFVSAPGKHPLVAAFPILNVSVQADSIHVQRVTTITTSQGEVTETSHTYETSTTKGQATSIADTVTWNNWEEVSESIEFPIEEGAIAAQRDAALTVGPSKGAEPDTGFWERVGKFATGTLKAAGGVITGLAGCGGSVAVTVGSLGLGTMPAGVVCAGSIAAGTASVIDGFHDWGDAFSPDDAQNPNGTAIYDNNTNSNNNYYVDQSKLTDIDVSMEKLIESNVSLTVNRNFETQGIENRLEGISYAIDRQGALISQGFYDVSHGLNDISEGLADISDGLDDIYMGLGNISDNLGEMTSALGNISYQISRPRVTETRTSGHSYGGEQSIAHEEYEEHAITQGEIFSTAENWSTAWAQDSSRAGLLSFTYTVANEGTDYARVICNLSFNIFVGDDPNPIGTYNVGLDLGGDGCFSNYAPGEDHRYSQLPSSGIELTLEQMKTIDLGGPIRIVVEDFALGQDDYYADDALGAGVLVAIEDGVSDGDELVDRYVIPTWGMDSVQDVLLRYFPAQTDSAGNIMSLWTPEFPEGSPPTWQEHFLSEISWWNIYLSQPDAGNTPLHELPAQAGSSILFRFSRDSDRDGYNDRTEARYGTDKNDPGSHPEPELLAGYVVQRAGNDVTVLLKLANTGTFNAYNVSAVMYAPDDTTTILNNTIGGNGVVSAGRQLAVGSLVKRPDLLNWSSDASQPYAGGNYTGEEDHTYVFTAQTGGEVGSGTTSVSWSDGSGGSGVLAIGSGYHAPLPLPVADGLEIGLESGKPIVTGQQFTVKVLTPRDTFKYRISDGRENNFTEPVIVVSYSSPRGAHRFATTVRLDSLSDDLFGASGQMLKGVRLDAVATPFQPDGANTTHYLFNNPHPETIHEGHLYVNVVGGGSVAKEYAATLDVPNGPTVYSLQWSTADFDVSYDETIDYVLMGFWTDRYGNIIDTISRPLSSLQSDQVMKADVPSLTWDVGAIRAPQSYSLLNKQMSSSHTEGGVKQSSSYQLRGSAGGPSAGLAMTSANYSLRSGYWAGAQAQMTQLQSAFTAALTNMPQASGDVLERFPTHRFVLADTGTLPLIIGVASVDAGLTITQPPHKAIGSGAFTEVGVRLNTDGLPLGPFDKRVTLYTNDPAQPHVELHVTGVVEPAGDVVFVSDYQDEARPLNRIAHVNSSRDAGQVVTLQHGIPGDNSNLEPLFLYDNTEGVPALGIGAAVGGSVLSPALGDRSATELTLPEATASRRDYILYYGYRADLPGGGGTHTFQPQLTYQRYNTVTLDIVLYDPAANAAALTLDVGADGTTEWSFNGALDIVPGSTGRATAANQGYAIVHASDARLAAAVNAYFNAHPGATTVPVRMTTNIQSSYFLSNLRGLPSTDYELSIAGDVQPSSSTPTEADSMQFCATVVNNGQGDVPAAVLTFYVHDPAANTQILAGYRVLTDLPARGGQSQGCTGWDTTGYSGDVTVYAHADFLNQVPESNETNNTASTTVNVRSRPDLTIPSIILSDPEPTAGETVTVTLSLSNTGQTGTNDFVVSLTDNAAETGSAVIRLSAVTSAAPSFAWTPSTPGLHQLFVRADRDHQVNESDETNNDRWLDVYVGFASPLQIDSGGGDAYDPAYSAALGFGYLDGETSTFCGTGADGTQRSGFDGNVQYRFDHLLPGHFYHLDLTLYECDGLGRQQQVRIDDNLISDAIDLSDLKTHRLSFRLDPAFYADRSIVVSIEELTGYDALVSEINLYDIDYRYADAGANNEAAYSAARDYGWLDGLAQSTWGTLPYQTRRIDLGDSDPSDDPDNELRYRFDGLRPNKRYQLLMTVYQGSGTATIQQKVAVDSVDTGVILEVAGVAHDDKVIDVPPGAYKDDGTITVRLTRLGAATGAFVSEIALEELTLPPEQIAQEAQTLRTHTGGPTWFSFNVKPPVRPAAACTGVTTTSAFTSIYGEAILADAAVPVGTIVEAYTPGGAKTGCFKVTTEGLYGYMRVYGAEGATSGMHAGEPILFKINGIAAAPAPYPVVWQDDKATREVDLSAPDVIPVETLLAPVAGKYTRLQCETGTYLPPPADPRFNTCTTVAPSQNYLLWMNTASDLTITGSRVAAGKTIVLHAGYNWLGYLPACELTVVTALAGIAGKYDLLHSEVGTYKPPPANPAFNNFNTMSPGRGYMIHMTQAAILAYPADLCGTALNAPEPAGVPTFTCPAAATSRFTHFYGYVTPAADASPGAVILAHSPRGDIVGCGEVREGSIYPYLRVYGAEDAQPGMQPGERVRFTVNGRLVLPSDAALWQNDWAVHPLDLTFDGVQYQHLPLIVR